MRAGWELIDTSEIIIGGGRGHFANWYCQISVLSTKGGG